MRGLLTKDFLTIKNQGKSMILILAIGIIMIISGMNKTFVIGYLTFIASTFAVSTLSYDEYDHGYLYIFILPIERKEYVVEKYLFSAMLSIAGWFGSGVIIVGVSAIRGEQIWSRDFGLQMLVMLLINWVYLEFLIPIRLKYGAEKGKIVNVIVLGAVFLVAMGIQFLMKHNQGLLDAVERMIRSLQPAVACILTGMLILAAGLGSFCCSKKIMERMEF